MSSKDQTAQLGLGSGAGITAVILGLSISLAIWLADQQWVLDSARNSSIAQAGVIGGCLVVMLILVRWTAPGFLVQVLNPCGVSATGRGKLASSYVAMLAAGVTFGVLGSKLTGASLHSGLPNDMESYTTQIRIGMNLALTPIFEELLFRGVLYSSLRQKVGITPAVLVSSLAFAVVHLPSPDEGLMLVAAASAFAFGFERTKSLWPCVLGHAAMNWMYGLA